MKQCVKMFTMGVVAALFTWVVVASIIFRFVNPSATETQTILAAPSWVLGDFTWSEAGGKGE